MIPLLSLTLLEISRKYSFIKLILLICKKDNNNVIFITELLTG